MIKYKLIEGYRRLIQILYGGKLLTCPGLYILRRWRYQRLFNMGEGCRVGYNVVLHREHGNKEGAIRIGKQVLLSDNVKIDYSGNVNIDDFVWISDSVHIHTHIHPIKSEDRVKSPNKNVAVSLSIGRGAWIGDSAIILPSCHMIGAGAIVGAGSIITKDVPENVVVAGNPGRIIKYLNEENNN